MAVPMVVALVLLVDPHPLCLSPSDPVPEQYNAMWVYRRKNVNLFIGLNIENSCNNDSVCNITTH